MPINLPSFFTQSLNIGTKINEITNIPGKVIAGLNTGISSSVTSLFSNFNDVSSKLNIGKLLTSNAISIDAASLLCNKDTITPTQTSKYDEQSRKNNHFIFPAELQSAREFMKLEFMSYPNTGSYNENRETKVEATIFLPLPADLRESFSVGYDSAAIGALVGKNTSYLTKAIDEATNGGGPQEILANPGKYSETVKNIMSGLIKNNKGSDTIKYGAYQLADAIAPRGALSYATGVIANPYLVQIFQGIGFREFSFNWKLTPNNEQESDELRRILFELKTRMLPGMSASELFLTAPNHCQITFRPEVFRMTKAVIAAVDINHAPNGPAFYNNDSVFEYDLSIQVKEIELVTRDKVRDWESQKGTS